MTKLIIEIDEKDYNRIKDIPDAFDSLTSRAYKSIKNGTPLPKGVWQTISNKNGTPIALRCTACGNSPKHAIRSDYCPNCGASMRGDNNADSN